MIQQLSMFETHNKKMRILVACEESQAVTIELRKLGHEAYSCDIQECSGGHPEWHLQCDALELLKMEWDMIIAFPPCTHLCNSGQRWFTEGRKDKRLQEEGASFFMKFANANCQRIAIENPVGVMSSKYRKPDQIINPYEFGETECKKTCLWLKGIPKLMPTKIITKDKRTHGIWKAQFNGKQYSWNDPIVAKLRSKTFPGIAKAMAEQWAGKVEE